MMASCLRLPYLGFKEIWVLFTNRIQIFMMFLQYAVLKFCSTLLCQL